MRLAERFTVGVKGRFLSKEASFIVFIIKVCEKFPNDAATFLAFIPTQTRNQ